MRIGALAPVNLYREFEGVFGAETMEKFLSSSYDQFASRAQIPNFLPLLASASRPST